MAGLGPSHPREPRIGFPGISWMPGPSPGTNEVVWRLFDRMMSRVLGGSRAIVRISTTSARLLCREAGARGLEIAAAAGPLVLVDRALVLGRRQRHPHRHRCQTRRQARLAEQQLLVELVDALL